MNHPISSSTARRDLTLLLAVAASFLAICPAHGVVNVTPQSGVFVPGSPGGTVEFRRANGFLNYTSMTSLDAFLALPLSDPSIVADATDNGAPAMNYMVGGGGNDFPNPRPVTVPPLAITKSVSGQTFTVNSDNFFVMRATGFIFIPAAGSWTFAVKSDDACRLKLGVNMAVVTQAEAGRGPAYFNTLGGNPGDPGVVDSVANVPSAGFYPFEFLWSQGGGGAMVQLTAAQGSFPEPTSFSSGFLPSGSQLVGDTAHGGLLLCQQILPATGILAAKGGQVDGEFSGTAYSTFGVPSLDSFHAGFLASIKPQSLPAEQVIVQGFPLDVLVREGDEAPGVPNAVFASFKDPLFGGGHCAFQAALSPGFAGVTKTNAVGLWSNALGSLELVAREGDPAPGVSGATFKSFLSIALPPAGGAIFVAKLAGVPSNNSLSLWRETSSGPALILQQGGVVNLASSFTRIVTSFTALPVVPGSPDQRRFPDDGSVPLRLTFTDHSQAVVNAPVSGPAFNVVASSGDQPVGLTGAKFASFGTPAQTDAGYAVLASLQTRAGGVTSANSIGIFAGTAGNLSPLVRKGDPAPGISNATFTSFLNPALAGSSSVAFTAKLVGAGVSSTNNSGIFTNALGSLQLVARTGNPAPDVANAKFLSFTALSLPDLNPPRGPVFLAKLAPNPGVVDRTNNLGLWYMDSTGAVHLLVRTGDSVEVNGAPKIVQAITALGAVSPSPAQPRGLNPFAQVAYKLTFTDHTQGIAVSLLN